MKKTEKPHEYPEVFLSLFIKSVQEAPFPAATVRSTMRTENSPPMCMPTVKSALP